MKKRYYFIGVCGISMSTLAIFLKKQGNFVSGSDKSEDKTIEFLKQNDIYVDKKINRKAIKTADIIVCSSAIKEDNAQLKYAKMCNKKIVSRGEILGQISKNFKKVIAVAGSHGKTTTTAMIYEVLKCAGFSPTLHLGGYRIEDGKNYEIGKNDFFVTEACEYCDNFLFLNPDIGVVTNIEKEHMDFFKTFERQVCSFEKFKKQCKIVIDSKREFCAKNVCHKENGCLSFDLYNEKNFVMNVNMHVCQDINTENAIYAYLVTKKLGIDDKTIKIGLERFIGVKSRFEKVVSEHFETVICDYAHHPTEILKTIETASKIYGAREIITIFQPHTFSRTKILCDEFVETLSMAKNLILFKTYSAREKKKDGMSAFDLSKKLNQIGVKTNYFATTDALIKFSQKKDRKTVVLIVGAGNLPSLLNKKKFIS